MLGSFLEIGIDTDDIASAFAELLELGFTTMPVADIRSGAYAVVSDGAICIALNAQLDSGPALTFVRPDLASYLRALRRHGIELEFCRLGDQEFHELGFRDPDDQLVTLVEARTFAPPVAGEIAASICGRFLEYSICTADLARSQQFWTDLGLSLADSGTDPHPWSRLTGSGVSLGLHQTRRFQSGPSFAATQLDTRTAFLRAKGINADSGAPMFPTARAAARLRVAGALSVYLVSDPADAD